MMSEDNLSDGGMEYTSAGEEEGETASNEKVQ